MIRKLLCLTLLMFLAISLPAQKENRSNKETEADLEKQLEKAEGKDRISPLLGLAYQYQQTKPEKTLIYGKEAQQLLKKFPDDRTRVKILSHISWAYSILGKPKEAEAFAQKSLDLASNLEKNLELLYYAHLAAGQANYVRARFDKALVHFHQALEYQKKISGKGLLYSTYNHLGKNYFRKGDFPSALKYFLEALKDIEEGGKDHKKTQVVCYNNIGAVYSQLGDYNRSINYYRKAVKLARSSNEAGVLQALQYAYSNLGVIYTRTGDFKKSEKYYKMALEMTRERGNTSDTGAIYNNLGALFQNNDQFGRALEYLKKALQMHEAVGDDYKACAVRVNMCNIYRYMNRLDESIKYGRDALETATRLNYQDVKILGCRALGRSYSSLRNYAKSREYFDRSDNLQIQKDSKAFEKQIAELQTRFDTEKKEKEIQLLKQKTSLDQLEISHQRYVRNVIIAGLFLLLGFILVLINRHRLKNRTHKELQRKNEALTSAMKNLEAANEEIKALGGLLPICSQCKRIRDDGGYWHQVEVYIRDHSAADFSHSICPSCLKEHYPGIEEDDPTHQPHSHTS